MAYEREGSKGGASNLRKHAQRHIESDPSLSRINVIAGRAGRPKVSRKDRAACHSSQPTGAQQRRFGLSPTPEAYVNFNRIVHGADPPPEAYIDAQRIGHRADLPPEAYASRAQDIPDHEPDRSDKISYGFDTLDTLASAAGIVANDVPTPSEMIFRFNTAQLKDRPKEEQIFQSLWAETHTP
ncbi:hypothetical protein EK21DRAFT_86269 [Setomelanomma holmii]|uniref:Uncharacterized protein n=1 Tax=Setomelanomma holmii TaxID=210430 RepID=A0A9P4HH33_9PLEO|nr:hypothetical protein EK21DRAFT_86269 [Setomelanomma holmii]